MPSLRKIFTIQLIITTLSCLVLGLLRTPYLWDFFLGALFITFNFVLGVVLWKRIWDKKPVAWTIVLLVFKYAVLITVLYVFVVRLKLALLPLFAGVTTLGATFLVASLTKNESE